MIRALLTALCGRAFHLYPQHRWRGAEAALTDVGLMESVHGLASTTFRHLLDTEGAGPSTGYAVPASRAPVSSQTHVPGPEPPAGDPTEDEEGLHQGRPALADPQQPVLIAELAEAGATDLAALNHRRKQQAAQFLKSHPLPPLLLLKVLIRPLARLLEAHLRQSGLQWQLTEAGRQAESAGADPAAPERERDQRPKPEPHVAVCPTGA